ncbi:MAG: isopentenyl-diphosphate Delta-isomerase [Candidatus Beckwithbacteria bacterium]
MINNKVILVTKDDQVIGQTDLLTAHQGNGQLHRAISVLIFNSKKELLIQQRSIKKPLWPLFWTNTCCSHPRPKENYKKAAERRLFEEMGLRLKLKHFYTHTYQARYNQKLSEHEIDAVFIGTSDDKPKPDKNEIADFKYLSLKNLKKDILDHPKIYTPWFKLIMKKVTPSDILTS